MVESNVLLALAFLIVTAGLVRQYRAGGVWRPCAFYWGVMFVGLFVVLPLASNLLYGPARSLHWWKEEWITSRTPYLIYGVTILGLSLAYFLASIRWVGRRMSGGAQSSHKPSPGGNARRSTGDKRKHVAVGLLSILGVGLYMLGTGLPWTELLSGGRFLHYERGGTTSPTLGLGLYMISLVAYYGYLDAKLRVPSKLLSSIVYGAILLMVLVSGGRKWLVFAASGLIAGSYDRERDVRVSFTGVAAVGCAVGLVIAWQAIRAVDLLGISFAVLLNDVLLERLGMLVWEGDATHFYRASLEAIRANLHDAVVYPFAVVRRIALLPFPNEWTLGLKPEGIPFLFADQLQNTTPARGGNVPPGFVGSFVLSFGWKTALIVAPTITLAALKAADWLVREREGLVRDVVFANFIGTALLVMRGSEGGIYFLVFNLLVVAIVSGVLSMANKIAYAHTHFSESAQRDTSMHGTCDS